MVIIDIDHFKASNDAFGPDVGDVVLKELATKYDNAFTYKNKFARLGGEEFGGYLPTNNMMQACDFSKQLITIAHTIMLKFTPLNSKHGVAMQTPNEPLDKVMKRADQALYLAKKNGRDRFEVAP